MEQVSFNCKAAVTIHSDFGDQENKICPCDPTYMVLIQKEVIKDENVELEN